MEMNQTLFDECTKKYKEAREREEADLKAKQKKWDHIYSLAKENKLIKADKNPQYISELNNCINADRQEIGVYDIQTSDMLEVDFDDQAIAEMVMGGGDNSA